LIQAATHDLLRAPDGFETPAVTPAEFVPSALLALADDPRKPNDIRAIASYDAAVLMTFSRELPTLQDAYRRLQTVKDTVSDKVTRDCASAFQYELGSSWRFEPIPTCRKWPWLGD
jgi:hypothetical protein